MRADSPAGDSSRPPRSGTSLSDSAALTGRLSPETPRSARSGAFSRPQRPKSRGRPSEPKRFKVDPGVGFDWCKGPHYARFPQDEGPKKEAWSFVCRMRGFTKPLAPEVPPASVTQIFQRHWQQIRQSKRPETDQAPKCRLEKGVVGKVSSPSFRAKPTATAKSRSLRESGPSELTIVTDSATQESSPEAPASPSTPARSPTFQPRLSRQGTKEKLHLSQVEAGLEKIATERLPRVRTFQFAADKEDEDVEEAATLSRDTAAFRELKAQVAAARTGTDTTEGGTHIPMPFTEDQALEVFTKLAEYEELHESELGRAMKMLGYMNPNEEWIREIYFDVAPTYNTIQINEYFIFVKAYAAKHHEACSHAFSQYQDPPRVKRGMVSHIRGPVAALGKIVAMAENWSEGDEQEVGSDDAPESPPESEGRRMVHQVRAVDLKLAWQMHAKECHQELSEADATRPVFRLLYRSRADQVWELLDDQNSSTAAWFISQFLKLFVMLSVAVTNFQTTEERTMDKATAIVFEFFFDAVFLLEFLLRLLSAPSKKRYISDPLNWADMLCALGLPCRIAFVSGSGFFNSQVRQTSDWNLGEVGLLFLLPLIRLMKLLRYFESIPLLIDACYKSFEALPLLTYIMALITFWSATGIYLVESRGSVPSMQHSLWLSLVTMTTVGYGDYYPTSIAGYFIVSVLTIVSVLFLALPVGIIGNEFTSCWQQRTRVLLLTRAQKCLAKWGYSASDVKILFEFMDVDGDGNLNLNEFMELFHQMRIGITTDSAVDLFQMFDDDQSGTIEYDEFLRHIFPEEYVKGTQKGMSIQLSRSRVVEALQHLDEMRTSD